MRRSSAFIVLVALGAIAILSGLVYGAGSQRVIYQDTPQGVIGHYLAANGNGYLQMANSSTLYIVKENDFRPVIDGVNTFKDGDVISLVYDPNETTDIDVASNRGTHLVGTAHKVVEITAMTANGQTLYVTPDYTQHPQGYTISRWGVGIALILVGLIMAVVAFFLPRPKALPNTSGPAVPFTGTSTGSQQQSPQNMTGYQQYPGTNTTSYSGSGHPQRQGGSNEAAQYANPYNQPPQEQ